MNINQIVSVVVIIFLVLMILPAFKGNPTLKDLEREPKNDCGS